MLNCVLILLGISTLQVLSQSEPSAPYITVGGRLLANNSYLNFMEIGYNISTGVQCHTDLSDGSHDGKWYYPSGGRIPSRPSSYPYLYTGSFEHGVALMQDLLAYTVQGIYRCDIRTNSTTDVAVYNSVFIGIYSGGG